MRRVALRAWAGSLVVLVVGGAGLFALTASSTSTSTVRMGLAAGVLALLGALAATVLLPRDRGTILRGALAATVPALVGAGSAWFAGAYAGLVPGLLAGLPWWVGASAGALLAPFVGELRRPALLSGSGGAVRR